MNNNQLLSEIYEFYYNRGIAALRKKEYSSARQNILAATEALLNIAKESVGAEKAQRLKRANRLYAISNRIERKREALS